MLQRKATVNASSRMPEGDPVHSILQHDMPDDEDPDGEEARKKKLAHCPADRLVFFLGKSRTAVTDLDWQSWFCQFIGVPLPALESIYKERKVVLAAVTLSMSTATMCTPARSTLAAPRPPTKSSLTRWKPSATKLDC